MMPPTQSPKTSSNMLINVSHPHPLSMQTANGGKRKHNKIEQQRLTILTLLRNTNFIELKPLLATTYSDRKGVAYIPQLLH